MPDPKTVLETRRRIVGGDRIRDPIDINIGDRNIPGVRAQRHPHRRTKPPTSQTRQVPTLTGQHIFKAIVVCVTNPRLREERGTDMRRIERPRARPISDHPNTKLSRAHRRRPEHHKISRPRPVNVPGDEPRHRHRRAHSIPNARDTRRAKRVPDNPHSDARRAATNTILRTVPDKQLTTPVAGYIRDDQRVLLIAVRHLRRGTERPATRSKRHIRRTIRELSLDRVHKIREVVAIYIPSRHRTNTVGKRHRRRRNHGGKSPTKTKATRNANTGRQTRGEAVHTAHHIRQSITGRVNDYPATKAQLARRREMRNRADRPSGRQTQRANRNHQTSNAKRQRPAPGRHQDEPQLFGRTASCQPAQTTHPARSTGTLTEIS